MNTNSYRKLCTEFYDIDKPGPPPDAFEFISTFAQQAKGPILELMSGSGRFLLPLLEAGLDIEGVDASPTMLEACRQRAAARGRTPVLHETPLHQLALEPKFSLAFIADSSFALITDEDQALEGLRRIRQALLPEGRFIIGYSRPPGVASFGWPWDGRWVVRPDGAKILISWLGKYDAETQIASSLNRYELIQEGRLVETEYEDFCLRSYTDHQFQTLLEEAGFSLVELRQAYGQGPPKETDEDIIAVCK